MNSFPGSSRWASAIPISAIFGVVHMQDEYLFRSHIPDSADGRSSDIEMEGNPEPSDILRLTALTIAKSSSRVDTETPAETQEFECELTRYL